LEYRLPFITPRRDMVKHSGLFDAQRPCHTPLLRSL
jgi:hypothetical protein